MSNSIKLKKFHFIYKTTNLINNNFYIGMHSTSNIKDGYIGSGKRLRYAIRKYGKHNFSCEIIEWCDNRDILLQREKELITEEHINNKNCYNLKSGGLGGGKFYSYEHMMKCSKAGNESFINKLKNDPEFKRKFVETSRKNITEQILNGKRKPIYEIGCDWTGKKHKESSKKLIGEKNSINSKGEKNSQYNTFWINKENVNKKIKLIDLDYHLKNGWVRGVKTNTNGELNTNSKLTNNDVVKIKQLLNENKLSTGDIGKIFKVARQTINKIKKELTWTHITI